MLLNKDIGFVELGQEVVVKVETFPFQKFGTVTGELIWVSSNAYADENMGYVYKIKVRLENPYLVAEGIDYKLVPGMQVMAEVNTGTRRVIDFFLEPLIKYLDESIKLR